MAWNYYGDDAYFHGAIKLGYWKIWFSKQSLKIIIGKLLRFS